MQGTRSHALDAARGVLMILGILLHTANIYSLDTHWLVTDLDNHPFFGMLASIIHAFRMPAFFWISGYFCALTFKRGGSQSLLAKRLPRLAIPLLVTWLTLNIAQEIILAIANHQDIVTAVLDGVPLYHLWFLLDLLIYISLAALVLPWFKKLHLPLHKLNNLPLPWLFAVLALATLLAIAAVRATGVAYVTPYGLTSLYRLASDLPYFAAGILMYVLPDLRKRFLSTPILLFLVAVPVALYVKPFEKGYSLVIVESALLLDILMTWISIGALLNAFHAVFTKESPVTRFLSEASYSVFLFHHVLVVSLGFAFIDVGISPWVKFFLICLITLAATSGLHILLIRRVPLLSYAFNGKSL